MEFLVLGPLRVAADGRLIEISAAKPRSMLGVLLVNVNQVVSADRLLEEVWGDRQPSGGVKTLQYHVSKLRDVLEPERGRGEEGCIGTVSGGTPPERVGTGRPPHLRMNWDFWPLLGTNGLLVR